MPANLASVNDLMKEVYRGQIREQINQEQVALKRIAKSSDGTTTDAVGGKYVTFPVHVSRNNGIGSRRENAPLPIPGQQGVVAARVGLKYGYAAVGLSGPSMRLTDTDAKAFAKALDFEINNLKLDVGKDMNRQVYGTGNGAIATVSATGSTNVITVSDARLVQFGEKVDIIRLSAGAYASTVLGSTIATPITVTATNTVGTNTVTISSGTPTVAVGDILVRAGSGIDALGNSEITGLAAIVSDVGTLFNIDPTTQPVWKAVNQNNSGTNRALSEGLMIQVADAVRTNGGQLSLILTSLGVRRSYFNLLSQSRSTVNSQEFTGGFKGLAFTTDYGEIPLINDPDAPLNTMWFLNESTFTYYHEADWDWLDDDGDVWKQNVDANGRYDSWVAYWYEYHELGIDRRNTNAVLKDITES